MRAHWLFAYHQSRHTCRPSVVTVFLCGKGVQLRVMLAVGGCLAPDGEQRANVA